MNTNPRRSQSALEYMMTYGWAILIIVIVAAVLYSMGIFSPSSSVSSTITGFEATPVSSSLCTPSGVLVLKVGDTTGHEINITGINSSVNGKLTTTTQNQLVSPGSSSNLFVLNGCENLSKTRYSSTVTIIYTLPGNEFSGPYTSIGTISGITSSFTQNSVANFTNSSYIRIQNSTSMYNLWHGRPTDYGYTLVYWANFVHAFSLCGSPSNSCLGGLVTAQGCVSGSYKYAYNSTYFRVNGIQWNGTAGCGGAARTDHYSLNAYAQYNSWQLITYIFNYTSSSQATQTICVNNLCYSNAYSITGTPDTYSDATTNIMGTYQINGRVADVQLYSKPLSQNQVKTLYREGYAGLPVETNGLVAWYPLNGNTNDYSGNNNNVVSSNIGWVSP